MVRFARCKLDSVDLSTRKDPSVSEFRSRFGTLLWGVALLCLSGSALGDLVETIDRVKPSVVAVGVYKASASPQYSIRGTGFFVGNGNTVATNAHVVSPSPEQDGASLMVQVKTSAKESQLRSARIIGVDREHDLAVLRVEGPSHPALVLADSDNVKEGTAVAFSGFPIGIVLGFFPVTHRGIVSAITPIVLPMPNSQRLSDAVIRRIKSGSFQIFQLDATAYPGNSGSPVFNPETGEVLGIINMAFVKSTKEAMLKDPSGIAYAIPAKFLSDLLAGK